MEVTNLNDSGTGSFRSCAEGSGARTCIFRVAGIVTLATGIRIVNPYLTVAGQSAPGGGIEIDGHLIPGGDNDMFVQTHDVIIRYIRVRVGNSSTHSPGPLTGVMCLWVGNGDVYNVMLDHVSMSWSDNKDISPYNNSGTSGVTRSYTTSWSIMSESIQPHSTGFMTGNVNGTANSMTDIDIHHTLFAHIDHRNPLLKNKTTRFVNNVVYDWVFYAFEGLGGLQADAIANKFKAGPSTDAGIHEFQISNSTSGGDTSTGTPTLYLVGNVGPHQASSAGNQWVMASEVSGENGSETGAVRSGWQRSTPLPNTTFPIATDDVNTLDTVIPVGVGASQRLDCLGNWVSMRDSYDTRILTDYVNGNYSIGSIPTASSSTAYPVIDPGTPCASTAHDGLPDAWKTKYGFSAADTTVANTTTMNGFTYLENYLNGTDPTALVMAHFARPTWGNRSSLADIAVALLTARLQFSTGFMQNWIRTSLLSLAYR
jgi:pectate lyase